MACLSSDDTITGKNGNEDQKYEEAKKLYAHLDEISKLDEDDEEAGFDADTFQTFFDKENIDHLFKDELLESVVTEFHRDNVANKGSSKPWSINGETLLLRAMSIPSVNGSNKQRRLNAIINTIVKNAPEMAIKERKGETHGYSGITPLHLAILKQDISMLKKMRRGLEKKGKIDTIETNMKTIDAKGTKFQDTVMMAGTPLGVAALKFNEDIFKIILWQFFSDLCVTNTKGDNIVHSLIKYVHLHPNYLDESLKMLNFILNSQWNDTQTPMHPGQARDKTRQLLICQNKEGLNPLQLAAKRQQYQIFDLILKHEVYRSTDSSDGLFDAEEYDVTEIETFAPENRITGTEHEHIKSAHHESILEYIITHRTNSAFLFADCLPVRAVIRMKWKWYRYLFWSWFILHVVFMSFLTAAALRRSKLESSAFANGSALLPDTAVYKNVVTNDGFVTAVSAIGVAIGAVFLIWEFIRRVFIRRFQARTSSVWYIHCYRDLTIPYSNTLFEIYFVLFSLCLVIDFAVAAASVPQYENYCLVFAVIIGWYLVMFYIQALKAFSFFTVLIQKVILDLARFFFVMSIFLVSYSAAMSMVMQGANTTEDDFDDFGKTMMKMLTIMLGIGELGILFNARHPALAIFLFVLFVLLTTILLLNALIALMSNSCTDLMSSQGGVIATKMHCRLQKLSVILFLESYLPRQLCKVVGTERTTTRNKDDQPVCRRFWCQSSVQNQSNADDDTKTDERLTATQTLSTVPIPESDKRKEKKSKKRKSSIRPTDKRLERRIEIKDLDNMKCNVCLNEHLVASYTQEIVETNTYV